MITYKDTVEAGEEVICIDADLSEGQLTVGNRYQTIHGLEKGIFPDRPYVSVIGDEGQQYSCHASRFRKLTPED